MMQIPDMLLDANSISLSCQVQYSSLLEFMEVGIPLELAQQIHQHLVIIDGITLSTKKHQLFWCKFA